MIDGLSRRHLPEVVLLLGMGLSAAWAIERAIRFGPSGFTLTGLGAALALPEVVTLDAYSQPLEFGGIALGVLAAGLLCRGRVAGAGIALLSVALTEMALTWAAGNGQVSTLVEALNRGWPFGLALILYGAVVAVR